MKEISLREWIDDQQRSGVYSFHRGAVEESLSMTADALSKTLLRLQVKGRIARVHKQFYVILPVEYGKIGMIPTDWFIDDLMEYLKKRYYVGLLTAAGLYGAGHQQPQEYHIVTKEHLQSIQSDKLSIRTFSKSEMAVTPLSQIKGHTGMLPVATPAATGLDLVRYANRIGGIESVAAVISELSENITEEDLSICVRCESRVSVVQRFGWILDKLEQTPLSNLLYEQLEQSEKSIPRALLDPAGDRTGNGTNRWKIIENIDLEVEA